MKKKIIFRILLIIFFSVALLNADVYNFKDLQCPKMRIWDIVSRICWKCIYPIKLGKTSINIFGSGYEEHNPNHINAFKINSNPVCYCDWENGIPHKIGLKITMWYPQRIIEIVRKRWCFISLGGFDLSSIDKTPGSNIADQSKNWLPLYKYNAGTLGTTGNCNNNKFFYHYHYMAYPLFEMLQLLLAPECNPGGYTDPAMMSASEFDLSWIDDQYAVLIDPEALVFANPLSVMACSADAVATSYGFGLDTLFWCNGSQLLYPLSGNMSYSVSPVREAFHLSARALAKMFRIGLARKSLGDDVACGASYYPFLIKEQYKLQLIYPKGKSHSCCVPLGRNPLISGWESRHIPADGEDYVFVVFQQITCCIGKNLF